MRNGSYGKYDKLADQKIDEQIAKALLWGSIYVQGESEIKRRRDEMRACEEENPMLQWAIKNYLDCDAPNVSRFIHFICGNQPRPSSSSNHGRGEGRGIPGNGRSCGSDSEPGKFEWSIWVTRQIYRTGMGLGSGASSVERIGVQQLG